MSDFVSWLFTSSDFMPHGHCYLWQPDTLWLNVASDGLIAAAYFVIPFSLYDLVRKRTADIPFPAIILMFAAFILLCGSTHIMEIWTVWHPSYRLSGALKLVTGVVSIATTIALFRLMPLALQLRSPRELRMEVDSRTAELAEANAKLQRTIGELERQREELQTMLDIIPAGIAIAHDSSGLQVTPSPRLAELWGLRPGQGSTPPRYRREGQPVDPQDMPMQKAARTGEEQLDVELDMELSDGRTMNMIVSAAPLFNADGTVRGAIGAHVDVTAVKQAQRAHQRALLESENRFRLAVEAVQGVLWTNSADGRMFGEQPGWAALTGQTYEQYQGFGWAEAVHPDDAQATIDAWHVAVRERRLFAFEHRVRRADGQWRRFSIRAIPTLEPDGSIREWVGVHIDITEQREGEESLRRTEAALRETDARKDVFLATLSHELRNPLAPIRNAASLLAKPDLTAEDLDRSRMIIVRQVRHMAALLDDLLDVSRITRGVFALKKARVNLQSLLAEAVETVRPMMDEKQHRLSVQSPDEPLAIDADPVRLVQIVTNLLTNAAKYTDPQGQITLGAERRGGELVIFVRDNGIGLPPEKLGLVFEMFSQVAPDQGRAEGGLGIGLALVKGLVELHGGRIEARSEGRERGSEFVVHLPHVAGGAMPSPSEAAGERETARAPAASTVVVADDNQDGADSLAMLLEASGYQVFVAHNGTDALSLVASHRPRFVILDIGMPGLDGYQVAQRIRRESWGGRMTLIALTGWGQDEDKRRAQHAGFDHHLTKPVDPSALDTLLESPKGPD